MTDDAAETITLTIEFDRQTFASRSAGNEGAAGRTIILRKVWAEYDAAIEAEKPLGPGSWIEGEDWLDPHYWVLTVLDQAVLARISNKGQRITRIIDASHPNISRCAKPEWGDELLAELDGQ